MTHWGTGDKWVDQRKMLEWEFNRAARVKNDIMVQKCGLHITTNEGDTTSKKSTHVRRHPPHMHSDAQAVFSHEDSRLLALKCLFDKKNRTMGLRMLEANRSSEHSQNTTLTPCAHVVMATNGTTNPKSIPWSLEEQVTDSKCKLLTWW